MGAVQAYLELSDLVFCRRRLNREVPGSRRGTHRDPASRRARASRVTRRRPHAEVGTQSSASGYASVITCPKRHIRPSVATSFRGKHGSLPCSATEECSVR